MKIYALPLVLSALWLSSCVPLGIAAGAGAGIAATQEGGLSKAASDTRIQVQISDLWFQYNFDMFRKLDLTVDQGRVLITGVVQNPEHRVEAVRLAWQPKGVKQVINEITVADARGFTGYAKDTWITTKLRTSMTFNKEILSINYSIDTVQGTVYLMGYAQSQEELNKVTQLARTISGVKNVVSYVKLVGENNAEDAAAMNAGAYNDAGAQGQMGAADNGYDYSGSNSVPVSPSDPYNNDPNLSRGGSEPVMLAPDAYSGANDMSAPYDGGSDMSAPYDGAGSGADTSKSGIEVEVLN